MYRSYEKSGGEVIGYTLSRARRILPPYITVVLLCACALVSVSTFPAADYFFSSTFWRYLGANLSFLNWLQPSLPGVFEGPEYVISAVNGSLWTMKVEWSLYLSVPLFVWLTGRLRRRNILVAVLVIVLSIAYRCYASVLYEQTGREIYQILGRQIFGQLAYFYVGMLIYFLRDVCVRQWLWLLLGGLVLNRLSACVPYGEILLAPFAIGALVMGFSFIPRDIKFLRNRHNISYNIYLVHYPVVQLGIYTGVNASVGEYGAFGIVLGATVLVSWIGNRFIDRRFLKA